ncbi:MAG: hemolysin family protein [Sphingobacteriales bacterium JAD_PAG50586_3]|nr:MAG: hemolysin family protein [Sphingobacteriales bacterium JAD_PAG50586_3]
MEIVFIFVLMLVNGFFSMAEIALVSARKSRLETSAKKGSSSAKAALDLINKPNKLLSTVQIGITLIGLLTGIYSGENIVEDLTPFIERIESLQPFAHGIAVVVILVIVTFFSLVLGELVPKRIGLANPEAIAKISATPIKIMSIITAPFVWLLTGTTELLLKIFSIKPSMDSKVTEEEIKAIVQEGAETGEVEQIEQDIVTRVFSLGDRKVEALMTYRKNVVFLSLDDDVETINNIVNNELHSVYPVYKTDKDNIEGVVLLKDLYAHIHKPGFNLASYMHTPQFINEHRTAYDALELLKRPKYATVWWLMK